MPSIHTYRRTTYRYLFMASALVTGCATTVPDASPPISTNVTESAEPLILVTRYGRYTLVELAPTAAQQDLLLQVVDVSIPATLHASVGDGLRHVLQRSGYQLCHGIEVDTLNTLPLPAAHYHLGPLVLRDALSTLVGPAWGLHIDQGERQVCFRATDTLPLTEAEETRL